MKYYDIHTHLNYEPLSKNADHIANICKQKNILLNNIGTNLKSSQASIELAKRHDNVFACVGIHPNDVNENSLDECVKRLEEWLNNKTNNKIVAIGETGLDYHYEGHDKQKQLLFLQAHLKLAIKHQLPLMLHVRDAHEDMINFLRQNKSPTLKVIIHCFTSNEETVKQYINLDCYISIPGVITFKKVEQLEKAIKLIPLNRILSETDAPWLTPEPYRGKTNSPEYIDLIVKSIAKKLNMNEEEITNILFNNAYELFF